VANIRVGVFWWSSVSGLDGPTSTMLVMFLYVETEHWNYRLRWSLSCE
jgi:hypothetical protein